MKIKSLTNLELMTSTESAVKEERRATMVVLYHLREIEKRRLYLKYGYSSLFSMVTKKFGYSEASAQRRINAMRLVRDMPEAAIKISSGELTLTAAASVQSFFRDKRLIKCEKTNILNACVNKSTREVEKNLAALDPEKDKREDIRYSKSDRLRMSLNISEDLYAKLETSKYNHNFKTIEDLVHYLVDKDLKEAPAITLATPAPKVKSRYISNITKKIVMKRNPEQACEYRDPVTQERCHENKGLQFDHHHIPHSKGGPPITENLRQLCGHHNRLTWHKEQKKNG